MQYNLSELISKFGGVLYGDDVVVSGIASIRNATDTQLTFIVDNKYIKQLIESKAKAIIVSHKAIELDAIKSLNKSKIVIDNPYLYFSKVSTLFNKKVLPNVGIKASVSYMPDFKYGLNPNIYDNVVIGSNVSIGDNVTIYPNVVIADDVIVGDNVTIYPNVSIYSNVKIGDNCVFHANSVIGSDGFGYAPDFNSTNKWHKIPQVGGVIIGNNVEIGASTTVDCGTLEPTIIQDGVIIDNLVQVAHNVEIGSNTAIAACSGIAGSVKIGKNCTLAGGVGISGHLSIADNTVIGGASTVSKTITEAGYYVGLFPLMQFNSWTKAAVHVKNLNKLHNKVNNLTKELAKITEIIETTNVDKV